MFFRRLRLAVAAALAVCFLLPGLAAGLQRGQSAPPIDVTSVSGQRITNANYGGYVSLVLFFDPWCSPCREAVPVFLKVNKNDGKHGV